MGNELFRREVLQARDHSWLGGIQVSTSRVGFAMAVVAVCVILVLLTILFWGAHTRKVRASGYLLPVGGVMAVAAPAPGVLMRVLAPEGEHVTKGQPLLEISGDVNTPFDELAVADQIAVALEAQQSRLQEDLAALRSTEERRAQALAAQVRALRNELRAVDREIQIRIQQAEAATSNVERIRPLHEDKIVSRIQMQQYEGQALDAAAQRENVVRTRFDLERRLTELVQELEELPQQTTNRKSEIERAVLDLSRSIAQNHAGRTILIRSPGSGAVSGLLVEEGQSVDTRQHLLSIIPDSAPLQGEIWVSSSAVGVLEIGDRAVLRYEAFPFQVFGQQYGRVVAISGSGLPAEEIIARTGSDPTKPLYRVLLELDHQSVSDGNRPFPLRPHMQFSADLLLERRRLYQLLLERSSGAPSNTRPIREFQAQ